MGPLKPKYFLITLIELDNFLVVVWLLSEKRALLKDWQDIFEAMFASVVLDVRKQHVFWHTYERVANPERAPSALSCDCELIILTLLLRSLSSQQHFRADVPHPR